MTYLIYGVLLLCLLLPILNKKYLVLSALLLILFFYYLRVNCSNTIICKNGRIYFKSRETIERFSTNSSPVSVNFPVNINKRINTKDALKTHIESLKSEVDEPTVTEFKDKFKDKFKFVSNQNIYTDTHTHDTVGKLIYHLKDIDFDIFIQLYNKIGQVQGQGKDDIITTLKKKVETAYNTKERLGIDEESVASKKMKFVLEILTELEKHYNTFQATTDPFTSNPLDVFKKIESCKDYTVDFEYSKFDKNAFMDRTFGCPGNHYLKGIKYNANTDDNKMTVTSTCCEFNTPNEIDVPATLKNSQLLLQDVNCEKVNANDINAINRFSFLTPTSDTTGLKADTDYLILYKEKLLKSSYDEESSEFILIPHNGKNKEPLDIYKFQFESLTTSTPTPTNPTISYKLKNENLVVDVTKYLTVTNKGTLALKNDGSKFEFKQIPDLKNNKFKYAYAFREELSNNIATIQDNKLVLEKGNFDNPKSENQIFYFIPIDSDRSVETSIKCYDTGVTNGTTNAPITKPYHNNPSDYKNYELMCNANEYASKLLVDNTKDELQLTCNSTNSNKINSTKLNDFFNTNLDFTHTHEHGIDRIHTSKNSLGADLNKYNPVIGSEIELYVTNEDVFLNESATYSPIEKIFIMMVMLKHNNIKNYNIDYESLYNYYSNQSSDQTLYGELLLNHKKIIV